MDAVVFGNTTLDILCHTVDDVPRHESISFERAVVSPGGCGSNTAIGLAALGTPTALVSCLGMDEAAAIVEQAWERVGLGTRFVRRVPDVQTGISVGLIDSDAQPRFIHTSGANAALTVDALDIPVLAAEGARCLHIAAFLILPGVSSDRLGERLAEARGSGLLTSLDVTLSRGRGKPADLWPCLPQLDFFLCNERELRVLTGEEDCVAGARALRRRGVRAAIVKLGADGCWVEGDDLSERVPGLSVNVVDTTGAGDAFAAGFIAETLQGGDLAAACRAGNAAGARIVGRLGAVEAWFD